MVFLVSIDATVRMLDVLDADVFKLFGLDLNIVAVVFSEGSEKYISCLPCS